MTLRNQPKEKLFLTLFLTAYLVVAIFVLVAAPILATRWLSTPFPGGFLTYNLRFFAFNRLVARDPWSLMGFNLGLEDQLIALGEEKVHSLPEVFSVLNAHEPGNRISLLVFSPQEGLQTFEIALKEFSILDQLLYCQIPLVAAAICFFAGLWIFRSQRSNPAANALILLLISAAILLASLFDFFTTQKLITLLVVGLGLSSAATFQLAMVLPRHNRFSEKFSWLAFLAYPHNLVLIGWALFQRFMAPETTQYLLSIRLLMISLGISLFAATLIFTILSIRTRSPLIKGQSEVLLITVTSAILPLAAHLIVDLLQGTLNQINPLLLVPLTLFPISAAIILLRFNLPQSNKLVLQMVFYILGLLLFAGCYTLAFNILNQVLNTPIAPGNPWLIGSIIFLIVFTLEPIRQRLRNTLSPLRDRQPETVQANAMAYASALTTTNDKQAGVNLLHDAITESFNPKQVHIFLYHPEMPAYVAEREINPAKDSPFIYEKESSLVTTLEKRKESLYIDQGSAIPSGLEAEKEKMTKLGSILYIPIPASRGILGWVSLGPRRDGSSYQPKDLDLLESMINQFSIAYERAEAIAETKTRLIEMETLNQIAIAINTENEVDQLLTEIYLKIQALIEINYFTLIMQTKQSAAYERVFLLQDNKVRISTRHPQPLEADFKEENCLHKKESEIIGEEGKWLVVPLVTEEKTIGALCMGIQNRKGNFDSVNLNFINSIASLITGGIIKTSLLQNLQEQTEQLTTLNKLNRQLSSTLALAPLLNNILESALLILDSEAGSLLIADHQTDELVFEVTAGPVADILRGQRMPKDKGFAGRSYTNQTAIITDNVQGDPLWFQSTDEETGFTTTSLIVVPLIARGNPIGVLEVINKRNGKSFNQNDRNLLESFASQAAIAIENARLYTRTDQALEKRVEELSTMQRIDRELNTSRDINPALQVTLHAALRHTQPGTASIGLMDLKTNRFRNIWHLSQNGRQLSRINPIDLRALTHLPLMTELSYQAQHIPALGKRLGITTPSEHHFPIRFRLEEDLYALMILHLDDARGLGEEDLNFLTRLVDHAAIALTGAVLYQNLHDVIAAKNEFISFISHELKNPLTAIKGYADLLSEGTVGEITPTQAEFLKTIKNNVRRMNTFITDLADQTHIETKSLRLAFSSTNVNEALEEVLRTFNQQFNEKSIHLETEIPETLPKAWCDRLRLIQILSNLISNAIKYTPEDGTVRVCAEHTANIWDPEGVAEVIHFSIKDNGYGIPDADQSHIFEKFYRGSDSRIRSIPGSGLGLIISKSLTEIMGGTMWFESDPGEGSTFHFTMPI
jgi:signal transduction histidine kinase/putative methionine-R-sulfoxide reductase with GAF domain